MILFTTLAGAAQGLLLVLVALDLGGATGTTPALFVGGAGTVVVLGLAGLVAAAFHLGHPFRAWRAVAMWRTSWLSREVIVLPAFLAVVTLWGAGHALGRPLPLAGVAAALLALLLYLCTGMIYGAVKAIREWATPLTPVNFGLIGFASGALLAGALCALLAPGLVPSLAPVACGATLLAAAGRAAAWWRNHTLKPKTTIQSALGVRHPKVRQISQGAMAPNFNRREFFHGRTPQFLRRMQWAAGLLGFALPAAVLALGGAQVGAGALALLFLLQYAGLLAERWAFFAEGNHTQNLYQRAVG
ncbi:anaerobic dimethyl sulfoxide reductase, chain C [Piscinibacter sakaiensis]|uniref:Anaerobic dimethyl sulfoxide reductase, chain C n=2 Tax=Piscinibacter sakaiensis TaxID=1547922 RepID=A0A0K8P5K3_PISS1|nr:anaerobic dimethyl sulfoxide reductase, chain C [Piscinibacter sakaiensis]